MYNNPKGGQYFNNSLDYDLITADSSSITVFKKQSTFTYRHIDVSRPHVLSNKIKHDAGDCYRCQWICQQESLI